MDTVEDGPISEDLTNKTQLIPIIFSHGYNATRTTSSCFLRDLASHGFIVFSIDHVDGSCYHSVKADGTEMRGKPVLESRLYDLTV